MESVNGVRKYANIHSSQTGSTSLPGSPSSSPFQGMVGGERLSTNAFRAKQFQKNLALSQPSVLDPTQALKLFSYGSSACKFPPATKLATFPDFKWNRIEEGCLLIEKYFCVVYDYAGKVNISKGFWNQERKIGGVTTHSFRNSYRQQLF